MAKIICEHCGTEFKFEIAKDFDTCPVCGASLMDDPDHESPVEDGDFEKHNNNKAPSFGDDVKLYEYDYFDEDKIDFWWSDIIKPGETWRGITFSDGDVSMTCVKCGYLAGSAPYPIARVGDYLLMDSRLVKKCSHCGNEMKNHILSKRPSDWVNPRQREIWTRDKNEPRCLVCGSTQVHKISLTNKAVSAIAFGFLAAGHVSKTYKCDICGAKF